MCQKCDTETKFMTEKKKSFGYLNFWFVFFLGKMEISELLAVCRLKGNNELNDEHNFVCFNFILRLLLLLLTAFIYINYFKRGKPTVKRITNNNGRH